MARRNLVFLGIGAVLLLVAVGALIAAVRAGGAPEQPIAFPHDLHAGTNKIPCMYCHSSADRSQDAGIPSMQVCAGCHMPGQTPPNAVAMVRGDRPGVQQLVRYYNEQIPIPWVRIYDLPDHAHFPHMMHVNAGVSCQECHGAVETMKEVTQVASLRMGWCLSCHETRKVRQDCTVCHY